MLVRSRTNSGETALSSPRLIATPEYSRAPCAFSSFDAAAFLQHFRFVSIVNNISLIINILTTIEHGSDVFCLPVQSMT